MTRRFALHTLAIATAALTAGTPAEAGGGVRLSFGGPLPSFVATPTPGYGGGSGYSAPRKSAPAVHAAKRRPAPPVVTAERNKPAPARVMPVRLTTPAVETPKAAPALPVTASKTETPGLLGRTLVLDGLPRAETVHAVLPSETVHAEDAPDVAVSTPAPEAKAEPAPKVVATGPATCRKFIPAVGVTVTVACD